MPMVCPCRRLVDSGMPGHALVIENRFENKKWAGAHFLFCFGLCFDTASAPTMRVPVSFNAL